MSTRTCKLMVRTSGWLCLLVSTVIVSGCSAPSFFAKKDKPADADLADLETNRPKEIKKLKNPVSFHLTYAKWREQIGDLAEARQSYEIALSIEPQNIDAQLGMGRIEWQTGQHASAEKRFDQVLSLASHKPEVLDEVAQFYAEQERWTQATQLLQRASQLAPENKNYRYHYGIALAYAGDLNGSYDQLNPVIGEAETFYNLGQILYKQGNVREAESHLVRAMQLKPDLVEARNLLDEMHVAAGKPIRNPNLRQVSQTVTAPPEMQQPTISPHGRSSSRPAPQMTAPGQPQPFPEFDSAPNTVQQSPFYQ